MSLQIESTTDSAHTSEEVVENKSAQGQAPGESTEESDASDEVSDDNASEESGDESEEQDSETKSGKKPKQNGFKKRLDKLTKRASAAQQEAEYWKAQALKQAKAEQETQQKASAPKQDFSSKSRPKAEDFDTHEDFVEALSDWKYDQRRAEDEAKVRETKVKSEFQKRTEAYSKQVEEFKNAHDDYADVLDDVADIIVSPAVHELILASEIGPQLTYELAKNREEFERINKLNPLQAAREMGKLEARLASESKGQAEIKTTKAPKPLSPIGGKSGAVAKSIFDPNLSFADYEKIRREQMKSKK